MLGNRFGRGAFIVYLVAGTLLLLGRVSLLVYLNLRMSSHTVTAAALKLGWLLYPEALVIGELPFSAQATKGLYYASFCLLLLLGSYVFAIPVLFLVRSRRSK